MTEQEVNNLIDSKIGKVKMSQLPETDKTGGLYSIGYIGNQSVKYKSNLLQGDPLTVRKTYQTEAEALADKNPIDTTTSLPLTVGQFVSIVDDGEKNGIYRISFISGDGTMSLELQGKLGDLSEYLTIEEDGTVKRGGVKVNPKTIISKVTNEDGVLIDNLYKNKLESDLVFSNDEFGLFRYIEKIEVELLSLFNDDVIYKPNGNLRQFSIHSIAISTGNVAIYRETDDGSRSTFFTRTTDFNTNNGIIDVNNGYLRFIITMRDIPLGNIVMVGNENTISDSVLINAINNKNNLNIKQSLQLIEQNVDDISANTVVFKNILPFDSRLDKNTYTSHNGIYAGWWQLRYGILGENLIEKVDDYFKITLDSSGGLNPAIWITNKIDEKYNNQPMVIKFDLKSDAVETTIDIEAGGSAVVNKKDNINATSEWVTHEYELVFGTSHSNQRVSFYQKGDQGIGMFDIKNVSVSFKSDLSEDLTTVFNKMNALDMVVAESENQQSYNTGTLPNTLSSLMTKIYDDTPSVVELAFFGDSWTQGIGDNIDGLNGYVKSIARVMQEKYGYAGLGWYDFGVANTSDMECASDEAVKLTKTGSMAHPARTPDALGMAMAHTILNTDASYLLEFIDESKKVDRAVVKYYNGAEFTITINDGSPQQIVADDVSGWQSTEISGDIQSLEIKSTKNGSIIFGASLYYGNNGVVINKFGCRGLDTRQALDIDIDIWKQGLSTFNNNFFAVLLGTNDRVRGFPYTEVADNILKIINNAKSVHPYTDYVILAPSNNNSGTSYEMPKYASEMLRVAKLNEIVFLSLIPILGSKTQIDKLGLFIDTLHPTKKGGYMIAEYIYKHLFEYRQF